MYRSFSLFFTLLQLQTQTAIAQSETVNTESTANAAEQVDHAPPENFSGIIAEKKWSVLHLRNTRSRGNQKLTSSAKVTSLPDLIFTGPKPGHPFVLGNFDADGEWGLSNGFLLPVRGKNSAIQLCWADQFELEGIMEHAQFGGWFMLVGWDSGHGYSISNVKFKTSGSPWFISEMRGEKSIEETTIEFDHFNWKGSQPFKLSVKNNEISLTVGRSNVFTTPLENYKPGMIVLGVYDTEYGPKPIRVQSLRVREISSKN